MLKIGLAVALALLVALYLIVCEGGGEPRDRD